MIFSNISEKQILAARNKLFLSHGLPALEANGFFKSPFSYSHFGRNNIGGYSYDFCRIPNASLLECITVHIVTGDTYIHIYLNVFRLSPDCDSTNMLKGREGTQFVLPPNSLTLMQLRCDDYHFIPVYTVLFARSHNIGLYFTKCGFNRKLKSLEKLIKKDMENIDHFINRWHEIHKPYNTNWDGEIIL